MIVKQGFNSKPLHIRISHSRESVISSNNAELWIEQEGIPDESNINRHAETLSYISLQELIELRDETNRAIKSIAGVE